MGLVGLEFVATEEFADHGVVKEGVGCDLLEDLVGAVGNGTFEFLAECCVDLLGVQLHVVSVDLQEMLVDLDVHIGEVEAEALKLAGVVEFLQGDDGRLELFLEVVELEADHGLDEHLLHELLLTIGGLDLEDGHRETLGEDHEGAVIVVLICNKHLTLELELDVDCATEGGFTLGVNDDLGSEVGSNIEVSVGINSD